MVYQLDDYRVAWGSMESQVMSLGSRARNALSEGDASTARSLIDEAHNVIKDYEDSELGIPEETPRIKKHIGRLEKLL